MRCVLSFTNKDQPRTGPQWVPYHSRAGAVPFFLAAFLDDDCLEAGFFETSFFETGFVLTSPCFREGTFLVFVTALSPFFNLCATMDIDGGRGTGEESADILHVRIS